MIQNINIPHSLEVAGVRSHWMKHKTSGKGIQEKSISVSFQVPITLRMNDVITTYVSFGMIQNTVASF